MAINLDSYTGTHRQALVKLGEDYGSEDTLAQARKTSKAWELHGAKLKPHGFRAPDGAVLREAADMLERMEPAREDRKAHKRVNRDGYRVVVEDARTVRKSCRTELEAIRDARNMRGQTEAATVVETALQQTRRASRKADNLANQLTSFKTVFAHTDVAAVVAEREAGDVIAELERVIPLLREAAVDVITTQGTPAETEIMNLLDGIIISLVRRASQAAKTAADKLGTATLAKEFELDQLYRSYRGSRRRGGTSGDSSAATGTSAEAATGTIDPSAASTPPPDTAPSADTSAS